MSVAAYFHRDLSISADTRLLNCSGGISARESLNEGTLFKQGVRIQDYTQKVYRCSQLAKIMNRALSMQFLKLLTDHRDKQLRYTCIEYY